MHMDRHKRTRHHHARVVYEPLVLVKTDHLVEAENDVLRLLVCLLRHVLKVVWAMDWKPQGQRQQLVVASQEEEEVLPASRYAAQGPREILLREAENHRLLWDLAERKMLQLLSVPLQLPLHHQ